MYSHLHNFILPRPNSIGQFFSAAREVPNMTPMVAGIASAAVAAVYYISQVYGEYDQLKTERNQLESKLRILKAKIKAQGVELGTKRKDAGSFDVQSSP